jgi:hypothetical protein
MRHDIKLRRAIEQAGFLPVATAHILSRIPESAVDRLTSKEIAELMQAMHRHFGDGQAQVRKDLAEYIGLPDGVDIWAIIGDKYYLGHKTFDDGLNIPDILAARGRQIAAWKEREKPLSAALSG